MFVLLAFLVSCADHYSHDFLMLHPDTLRKEANLCDGKVDPYCVMVNNTLSEFIELVNAFSNSPEKFGEQLLAEEAQLVKLRMAKQPYQAQQQKVNDLLAIIAVTSSPNL